MQYERAIIIWLALGLAAAVTGCESDDSPQGMAEDPGPAMPTDVGTRGDAVTGAAGEAPSPTPPSTGGQPASPPGEPPSVTCGDQTCTVSALAAMFQIFPCCAPDGSCGGFGGECTPLHQPGMLDDRCPGQMDGTGMYPLSGCCTPDGACGLDYSAVDWGCVRREDVTALMSRDYPLEAMGCGGGDGADGGA